MNLNQVTVSAPDVGASVRFYQALGLRLIVDSRPRYARFECPDGASTFSVHQSGARTSEFGTVIYFECEDVDATYTRLLAAGLEFDAPPTDEPWLWREARLLDPGGNVVCLYYAGRNRRFPPWRVE